MSGDDRRRGDDRVAEQLRVGMIGCGIASFHLGGYAEEPRAKVVALAGLDTQRCQDLAAKYDIPTIYGDYHELLEREEVDIVSVGVPNNLHLPVAMAAIERGKHVLMEKPLALNAAEGERMVRAAAEKGVILAIAFNRRSRADMQVLKRVIDEGQLGEIYYAKAFWVRRSGIPGLGTWFTSKELSGGGPLIDLGVHVLDMALWLMGNPQVTTVSASTYNKIGTQGKGQWIGSRFGHTDKPFEVEDFAAAFMRTDAGATLHLEASWAGYTGHTDEFGVSFMGDKGGAELHVKDYATVGTLKLFSEVGGAQADTVPRLPQKEVWAGHAEIIHSLVDAILDGKPMSPSGLEGLDRTRLIDEIYRSAAERREITIEGSVAEMAGVEDTMGGDD